MSSQQFLTEFLSIQRRFDIASRNHLRTPWWRPFKTHYWLKQMQQATKDMKELGDYANAIHQNR